MTSPSSAPRPSPPQESSLEEAELDSAVRSLNDALRIGFRILRLLMLALLAVFLVSGVFRVREGEVAVRVRGGRLLGLGPGDVLEPGGPYFAWPAPIEEVLRVPTTVERLELDRAFWFEVRDRDVLKPIDEIKPPPGGLLPGRDGSLLTADHNLVHGRWSILFRVRDALAVEFVTHVGTLERARRLVESAAESGIVRVIASTTAESFIRGQIDRGALRRAVQEHLDACRSGIEVTEVLLSQPTPPLSVRAAFREVSVAESERAALLEGAARERSRIYNEVAGAGYRALLFALDEYERRRAENGVEGAREVEAAIERLLDGEAARSAFARWIEAESDPDVSARLDALATEARVGGRVSQVVNAARSDTTRLLSAVRSEAEQFRKLLPAYRRNPKLTRELLWREARQAILSSPGVETIYVPAGGDKALELEIDRDPRVERRQADLRYRARSASQSPSQQTSTSGRPAEER